MRVVVVAVDVAAVFDVTFEPVHGEVQATQAAGFVSFFDAANGELGSGVLLMFGHKPCRLHEHAAGAARGVENAAVKRFDDFGEQLDDAARRVELAAALALGHGEGTEEIFVDATKGVVVERGRNLRDFLQQFFEQGAGEQVEGFGQHAGELRVVLLDLAHRGVDFGADVGDLGQRQQKVKARLGREVEDAFGVIGGGFIDARSTAGRCASRFELGALDSKAGFSKTQKNEAKDRA